MEEGKINLSVTNEGGKRRFFSTTPDKFEKMGRKKGKEKERVGKDFFDESIQ